MTKTFEELEDTVDQLQLEINTLNNAYVKALDGLRDDLGKTKIELKRHASILSPLIEDAKASPYGWSHIATKEYVDKGLERLAGALRGEFAAAVTFVKELTKRLRDVKGHSDSPVMDMFWLYVRVRAEADRELEAAKRPSRVSSLIYAITGHAPTNGAQR